MGISFEISAKVSVYNQCLDWNSSWWGWNIPYVSSEMKTQGSIYQNDPRMFPGVCYSHGG